MMTSSLGLGLEVDRGKAASPMSSGGTTPASSPRIEARVPINTTALRKCLRDARERDWIALGVVFPIVFPPSTSKACKKRDTSHVRGRPTQI